MNTEHRESRFGRKQALKWLAIFAVFTLMAFLNFLRFTMNELAEGGSGKFQYYLIMETTGSYMVMALLPALLWFFRRFRLASKNGLRRLPLYLAASMVFGASHTTLMFLSRKLIFWLGDLGTYEYGRLGYRYLMEYSHQFFSFWIIWGAVQFIDRVREANRQKVLTAQLEQQLAEARLQALQMQLNPHFLFNTLNMISATMYDNVDAADKMMASLSDLLRLTLHRADSPKQPLHQEMELVQLYVEIMKARFAERLQFHLEVAEEANDALVPGFLLQPLVENSIKYSLQALDRAEIWIGARRANGRLLLFVSDSGPGLATEPEAAMQRGVGLSTTVERLEKLYGREHKLLLHNRATGGLEVTIEIPYQPAPAEARGGA